VDGLLAGEDGSDVSVAKLEEGSTRLVPQSNISNTFLLASASDLESTCSALYEISSISSDAIVIQAEPSIDQVNYIHTYIHIRLLEVDIRNQTENYALTRRKVIGDAIMLNKVSVTN